MAEAHDGADEDSSRGEEDEFFRQDEELLGEEDAQGVVATAEVVRFGRNLDDEVNAEEEDEGDEGGDEDGAQQVAVEAGQHQALLVWRYQAMRMRARTAPCSQ